MRPMHLATAFLSVLVVTTEVGCKSDGNSPTAPPTPTSLAEAYAGNALFNSATPGEHCFADGLPHSFGYALALTQNGGALTGVLDGTDFQQACNVQGSVDSNGSLSLSQGSCSPRCFDIALGSAACSLTVCAESARLTAVGSDRSIRGELVVEWTTSHSMTGVDLGPLRLEATIDLRAP